VNRQDLAMKIFVHGGYGPKDSFAVADRFIEEAERQKQSQPKEREPEKSETDKPECQHRWGESQYNPYYLCLRCGAQKDREEPAPKPEPEKCEHIWAPWGNGHVRCWKCGIEKEEPAPKREAREWDVTISPVGWIVDTKFVYNQVSEKIRVREILE